MGVTQDFLHSPVCHLHVNKTALFFQHMGIWPRGVSCDDVWVNPVMLDRWDLQDLELRWTSWSFCSVPRPFLINIFRIIGRLSHWRRPLLSWRVLDQHGTWNVNSHILRSQKYFILRSKDSTWLKRNLYKHMFPDEQGLGI